LQYGVGCRMMRRGSIMTSTVSPVSGEAVAEIREVREVLDHRGSLAVSHPLDGFYAELGICIPLQQVGQHARLELIFAIDKRNLTGIGLARQRQQKGKRNRCNP
jgi:hypothetical protein